MNDTPDSTREIPPAEPVEQTNAEIVPAEVAATEDGQVTSEPIEPTSAEVEVAEIAPVEAERVTSDRAETVRSETVRAKIQSDRVLPVQRRGSLVPMIFGGVVAAAVGFGLAQVVPQGWPVMDNSALSAEVKAQAATIADLQTRMAEMAQSPAPKVDPAVFDRLAAVEAMVAGLPQSIDLPADVMTRLDAVEKQLVAGPLQPNGTAGIDSASLARMQAEISALKTGGAALDSKLAEAAGKLDSIKADAEAVVQKVAARAALHQLQAALDSGTPYGSALGDLGGATLPDVLTAHAAAGLPSLQLLRASFPTSARAALDAVLQTSAGDSWTDRVGTFLRGQTGARSLTPRDGTDPDAVLSRAEAAVAAGDLTLAMTELGGLPEAGKAAMADWLAQAQQRLDAATAIQTLTTGLGQ